MGFDVEKAQGFGKRIKESMFGFESATEQEKYKKLDGASEVAYEWLVDIGIHGDGPHETAYRQVDAAPAPTVDEALDKISGIEKFLPDDDSPENIECYRRALGLYLGKRIFSDREVPDHFKRWLKDNYFVFPSEWQDWRLVFPQRIIEHVSTAIVGPLKEYYAEILKRVNSPDLWERFFCLKMMIGIGASYRKQLVSQYPRDTDMRLVERLPAARVPGY